MTDLLDLSDRVLRGEAAIEDHHPFRPEQPLAEVADGTAIVESFANVAAFRTDDGLCLVDTGSAFAAPAIHGAVRGWDGGRLHTAVYTHGHIDHVFGTAVFEEESADEGVAGGAGGRPRGRRSPLRPLHPDRRLQHGDQPAPVPGAGPAVADRVPPAGRHLPRDRSTSRWAATAFECHHARGETDDHTWVWVPERKVLCTGDLIIWCTPNAGNPQKVQRYARDWAVALRAMADLGAEVLLPGHGLPVAGADAGAHGAGRHAPTCSTASTTRPSP